MAYIYLNKENNNLRCFGSITALSKATGIKQNLTLFTTTMAVPGLQDRMYG